MLPSGSLQTVTDPADPYGYDYLVTLKDHALFTEDGFVTEGIKVKIGLNIEVEGKDYRVPGMIIAVNDTDSAKPLPKAANASEAKSASAQ